MKKILLLVGVIVFFSTNIFSQIVSENFDSYTAGQHLVTQAGTPWTTWSNSPGSSEDPLVDGTVSNTTPNSVLIATNNDLVLSVNQLTSGRYVLSFNTYIASGKLGYFNALQAFNGSNSKFAMQVYFNTNGNGSIDANGSNAAQFTFPYNTWFPVFLYVDLDEDFATLEINGNVVYSWQWSKGTFGDDNLLQLDAFDFYGWAGDNNNGTSGMYMDDVVFDTVSTPTSPLNLSATLNGQDISLTWNSVTPTPNFYAIFRNGEMIATNITDTSYTDLNVYPGDYSYTVRAFVETEGFSHASNEAQITVPGGVDRDYVLVEEFTEVNCYYCPGAAKGIDDMVSNGDNVAPVAYHTQWQGSDPFYTNTTDVKLNLYPSVDGTPAIEMDGNFYESIGGDHTQSLYPAYQPKYEERIVHKALYSITPEIVDNGNNSYTINVDVKQHSDYISGTKKLFVAITETDIPYSWEGQSKVNFALRKMIPNNSGESITFAATVDSQSFSFDFTIDTTWNINNLDAVVFLQDSATKEVMQTTKLPIPVQTNISSANTSKIRIYPNPATRVIAVMGASNSHYKISNILGATMKEGTISKNLQTLNIENLKPGIYFITIGKDKKEYTLKFVKQ